MIKKLFQTIFFALLFVISFLAAQTSAQLPGNLTALLDVLPTENSVIAELLLERIIAQDDGVEILCEALQKQPRDSVLQYAINGLAKYVSQKKKSKRRDFNKALCTGLTAHADGNVVANAFVLEQLKISASAAELKKIKSFLFDDKLIDPAIAVFIAVASPQGGKIILNALKQASDAQKLKLLQALGDLKYQPAEKKLTAFVRNENERLSTAALQAMVALASPKMIGEAIAFHQKKEKKTATDYNALRLQAARRLIAQGDKNSALQIIKPIDAHVLTPHLFTQLLQLSCDLAPAAGLAKCLTAAKNTDPKIAVAAVKIAAANRSSESATKWISHFDQINAVAQPHTVDLIAHAAIAAAYPFLEKVLQSDNQANRLAALRNLPSVAGKNAVPRLLAHLQGKPAKKEIVTVMAVLSGLPLADSATPLIAKFPTLPDAALVAALQFLQQKKYSGSVDDIIALLGHKNRRIRFAALQVLQISAPAKRIPDLLNYARNATSAREQAEYFNTIKTIAQYRQVLPVQVLASLARLQAAEDLAAKTFELPLLAGFGASEALVSIFQLTKSPDSKLADAAHRALFAWPQTNALETLLQIASDSDEQTWHVLAVRAIKRLIDSSDFIAAAKVHYISRGLAVCRSDDETRLLLGSLSQVQSADALRLALKYLENDSLKMAAGAAVVQIAAAQGYDEMDELTAGLLQAVLKNAVNSPAFDRIESGFITQNEAPDSFVTLFNGKDLSSWRGLAADPLQRQKMTAEEYAQAQVRADSSMHRHWRVEDGMIIFDGLGQSLCTKKDYQNYELRLEWKIEKDGDSGIYLRGVPQVQIWDPAFNKGVGSGGLFNNKIGADKPLHLADRPIGEWNSFRITLIDDRCTVYLNDVLVVDNVVLENYWQRDKKLYPAGSIELQAHHSPLAFRNIFIRELPPTVDTTVVDLFNGVDLSGWQIIGNSDDSWFAENGILTTSGKGGGWISTEREYADFTLELEFRVPSGGNSGVFLRAPHAGDPAYTGMEIQILDDYAKKYAELKPWQYSGSIYAVQAPAKRVSKAAGQWQKMKITCKGPSVKVDLNEERIIDTNLIENMAKTAHHPGLKRRKGFIGFQNHGARVTYRNVRIREF